MQNKKIAVSVFLIAFAFGLSITGIAPILGVLTDLYAGYGTSGVQILQTVHYALLMAGALAIGFITSRLGNKKAALLGLVIVGVFGVLPFFAEGYYPLLVCRVLIGFGFGVASPINTAIISEFIEQDKRPAYFGLHVVGMGIGCMLGNFLGGMLAGLDYKFFYLAYGIAFISVIGVAVLLPDSGKKAAESKTAGVVGGTVYKLSFFSFLHTLFITAYSTGIAIYIAETLSDNASASALPTAVNALFALLVGAGFAQISKAFKQYTLPVSILFAAVGFAAVIWMPGFTGVYVCSALVGASLSAFMARCSFLVSISVEPDAAAKASGIFSVIGGIGGLISPLLVGGMAKVFLGGNNVSNQFTLGFIGMAALAAIVLILTVTPSKQNEEGV